MALFGEGSTKREPRSLVEFRAGKMKVNGSTVTADARKGLVYMKMDDNLLHFCWKDRKSDRVEDDFIIFPGDAEIKAVSQCTTGRVVLLKFKDTNRKCFYWLQEPKDEKDEEYLKKVNEIIANPSAASSSDSSGGGGGHRIPVGAAQLQSLLQNNDISQQQLMEILTSGALGLPGGGGMGGTLESLLGGGGGGGGGSGGGIGGGVVGSSSSSRGSDRTHTPTVPKPQSARRTEPAPRLQLSDLQSALASIQGQGQSSSGGSAAGGTSVGDDNKSSQNDQEKDVSLENVLTSQSLRSLSHEEEFQQAIGPHLPPSNEDVVTGVTSPQFQQAVSTFSSALGSGQLGPLMNEFGLSTEVANAAATGSTTRFVEAIENELKEKDTPDSEEPGKDQDKSSDETKD